MSRSRNTENIRLKISKDDTEEHFRIIVKKPRIGDIHPISKTEILEYLEALPPEYLYHLKTIELLPRVHEPGQPYGNYISAEKRIVLYSHPLRVEYNWVYGFAFDLAEKEGLPVPSIISIDKQKFFMEWKPEVLKTQYLEHVLKFELDNHFNNISKKKQKPVISRFHELLAEVHKNKLVEKALNTKELEL